MNEYLFVLDDKGRRQTSYLLGAHADTYEELEQLASADYPNHVYMRGDENMQQKFVAQNLVYLNGEFTEYVPSADEIKAERLASAKAEYEEEKRKLDEAFNAANIEGNTEAMADIRDELKELKQSYMEEITNV